MTNFDYFVVFAEMRTGSNFLESNLNAFDGLVCHGEAFNPHFIGYPNQTEILGLSRAMRDEDPMRLVNTIKQHSAGLGGFRYFHDHDPRILEHMLDDPRCAKIILTRNPVDSYVSWKIAQATGQWKLTNVKKRKESKAVFEPAEFDAHLEQLQNFQVTLLNAMQRSGQTAFYVAYEDLQDVEVMNGLAQWLGLEERLDQLDASLKRQNPAPLSEKVENFDLMEQALVRLDRFNLNRTPNFEPRRGANVPGYVAAKDAPLLFLPVPGAPERSIYAWLAALDRTTEDALQRRFSQKTLRQWRRANGGSRSFTVIRHPVARIHDSFCRKILSTGPQSYPKIRKTLIKNFGLPLPDEVTESYDAEQHRAGFVGFLNWLKANLAGQTAIRVDAAWASQSQIVQGFADFAAPDLVLREEELESYLPFIASQMGYAANAPAQEDDPAPVTLAEIYDADIEALVASLYQKDYATFGFGAWQP